MLLKAPQVLSASLLRSILLTFRVYSICTPWALSTRIRVDIFGSSQQALACLDESSSRFRGHFWPRWSFPAKIWEKFPQKCVKFSWSTLLLFSSFFWRTSVMRIDRRRMIQTNFLLCKRHTLIRTFFLQSIISMLGSLLLKCPAWWLLCSKRSKMLRRLDRTPYLRLGFP